MDIEIKCRHKYSFLSKDRPLYHKEMASGKGDGLGLGGRDFMKWIVLYMDRGGDANFAIKI